MLSKVVQSRAMRSSAMTGSLALGGTHIAKILLRILSSVILTRLLYPEAFGYMAIVMSAVTIINLSTDIGVKPFLIRYPHEPTQKLLDVLWTIKLVRSLLLFITLQALSWPLADFYGDEKIGNLLRIVAFSSLLSSMSPLSLYWAEKERKFSFIAGVEFAAFVIQTLTVIIATAIVQEYWTLALGAVTNTLVMVTVALYLANFRIPRPAFDWEQVKEIWRFIKWITFGSVVFVLVMQADRFVIGKVFNAEVLGFYAIALTIAEALSNMAQNIANRVGFPTWADARRRGKLAQSFTNFAKIFLPLAGMASGMLIFMADDVVTILYDERYAIAGGLLSVLCLRAVLLSLLTTTVDLMIVDGKSRAMFTANIIRLVWVVGMLSLIMGTEDVRLYAMVFALMDLPAVLFYSVAARGYRRLFLKNIAFASAGVAVGGLLGWIGSYTLSTMLPWL